MTTEELTTARIEQVLSRILDRLDEISAMERNHRKLVSLAIDEAREAARGEIVALNANMPEAENSEARNPGEDKGWRELDVPTTATVAPASHTDPICPVCGVFGPHECTGDPA
jgi:hypothetical protein